MNIAWLRNRDVPPAPSRLWSLLDIMKAFNTELFLRFMELFGSCRLRSMVSEKFPPERDVDAYDEGDKASEDEAYATMEAACIELELTASRTSVRKIRYALAEPHCMKSNIMPLELELSGRLIDEMSCRSFFI